MQRPLAVKIYCGVIVLLLALALFFISAPWVTSDHFVDWSALEIALSLLPLALLLGALWGVWSLRWRGVIALTVLITAVETFLIVAMPERQGIVAIVRGGLWLAPLWAIAWTHRGQFR